MKKYKTRRCADFEAFINEYNKLKEKGYLWIFRGQRDSKWELESTLERAYKRFNVTACGKMCQIERNMIREFKRRLHHYTTNIPSEHSTDEWLALMQHYGAPTRLLDFTYSPYVAAYFAFEKADPDSKVAVWAVNASICEQLFKKQYGEQYPDLLKQYDAYVKYRTTRGKDLFKSIFMPKLPKSTVKFALSINPFRLNERLAYQRGVFLCPHNITTSFMDNLFFNTTQSSKTNHVIRFTIDTGKDNENAIEALIRLDLMNINRITLFPGLDGFAQSFGPRTRPLFYGQSY